jgi:anion-transporting  ArsA/GET3 family ATPase
MQRLTLENTEEVKMRVMVYFRRNPALDDIADMTTHMPGLKILCAFLSFLQKRLSAEWESHRQ